MYKYARQSISIVPKKVQYQTIKYVLYNNLLKNLFMYIG